MLLKAPTKVYIIVSSDNNDHCKHHINYAYQPQFDKIEVTDGPVTPRATSSAVMVLTDFTFYYGIMAIEGVTSRVERRYNVVQYMILHTAL